MFDLKALRDHPDAFRAAWGRRSSELTSKVDEILALDAALRKALTDKQDAEKRRNDTSKLVGAAKAKGDEVEFERLRGVVADAKEAIDAAGVDEAKAREALDALLLSLPNLPLAEVPDGADETQNKEIHKVGTPRKFNFAPKAHDDIGLALKTGAGQSLMDFESAAKMSGARFVALRGGLAKMQRALASFMLDLQTAPVSRSESGGEIGGYIEVDPPLLVKDEALVGTGQLPKFQLDLFAAFVQDHQRIAKRSDELASTAVRSFRSLRSKRQTEEEKLNLSKFRDGTLSLDELVEFLNAESAPVLAEVIGETGETLWKEIANGKFAIPFYLIPTAEVSLTNLVREQILDASQLPLRMTAHTPCFRSEAGSAGRDTKGMIRQHQFNKVELVSIVAGETEGLEELERMTGCAEEVLKRLDLPFRRVLLCTGDMGFGARKTYDLEVWLPSQTTYREISSCSYCGDFQARRMDARYRPATGAKPEFVHTLNGSGLAVGRTLVAVIENYQQEDGSIIVPDVLRGYMGGMEVIK